MGSHRDPAVHCEHDGYNISVFQRTFLSGLHSKPRKITSSGAKTQWFNQTPRTWARALMQPSCLYGRSSVAMCRRQERESDRGACQTLSSDAGRSLGDGRRSPITSAGVATRVSQERRSPFRSKLASSRLWHSRQARAMSPSWQCSSMRAQSPCPLIVRQVSSHTASSGCSLSPVAPLALPYGRASGSVGLLPLSLVLADSPARRMVFALSIAETEKPRQDALCCGWGEATAPSSQRGIPMATPLRHTTWYHRGPCSWRSVRVYHHWSTRARRWRCIRRVWLLLTLGL